MQNFDISVKYFNKTHEKPENLTESTLKLKILIINDTKDKKQLSNYLFCVRTLSQFHP